MKLAAMSGMLMITAAPDPCARHSDGVGSQPQVLPANLTLSIFHTVGLDG